MISENGAVVNHRHSNFGMFLNAIEIMLQNIRSKRDGLWKLPLSSVSAMLPFMFVTNRVNNSRWLPVYILDMFNLSPATNDMLQTHKPLNLKVSFK